MKRKRSKWVYVNTFVMYFMNVLENSRVMQKSVYPIKPSIVKEYKNEKTTISEYSGQTEPLNPGQTEPVIPVKLSHSFRSN